jgi:hypothetical protein
MADINDRRVDENKELLTLSTGLSTTDNYSNRSGLGVKWYSIPEPSSAYFGFLFAAHIAYIS